MSKRGQASKLTVVRGLVVNAEACLHDQVGGDVVAGAAVHQEAAPGRLVHHIAARVRHATQMIVEICQAQNSSHERPHLRNSKHEPEEMEETHRCRRVRAGQGLRGCGGGSSRGTACRSPR